MLCGWLGQLLVCSQRPSHLKPNAESIGERGTVVFAHLNASVRAPFHYFSVWGLSGRIWYDGSPQSANVNQNILCLTTGTASSLRVGGSTHTSNSYEMRAFWRRKEHNIIMVSCARTGGERACNTMWTSIWNLSFKHAIPCLSCRALVLAYFKGTLRTSLAQSHDAVCGTFPGIQTEWERIIKERGQFLFI